MLQMHTVVERPLTSTGRGSISCRPLGQEPIDFAWMSPDGTEIELEANGSEARNLPPGKYRIDATDASGASTRVVIDLIPVHSSLVTIERYRISSPSTSLSRDGSIRVEGDGVDGHRFLWSNGVETEGPLLNDVSCGTYIALPLPTKEEDPVPVVVHSCPPAVVDVSSQLWEGT